MSGVSRTVSGPPEGGHYRVRVPPKCGFSHQFPERAEIEIEILGPAVHQQWNCIEVADYLGGGGEGERRDEDGLAGL